MADEQKQIEAVQRMQDYIEAHFTDTITLSDLSRVSFFSPWYAHRLFLKHTGLSPADYIRRTRLSKSALKMRDHSCRIIDVAFEMGFGSVDGYQRAFFREFGCNPGDYAANPVPIYLFTPYGVIFRNTERRHVMENVKNVFIQAVEKPARKAIIKRGVSATEYFSYCKEEDYCEAIEAVRSAIKKYNPSAAGFSWDTKNPRIQLEPVGTRGYIELLPVTADK